MRWAAQMLPYGIGLMFPNLGNVGQRGSSETMITIPFEIDFDKEDVGPEVVAPFTMPPPPPTGFCYYDGGGVRIPASLLWSIIWANHPGSPSQLDFVGMMEWLGIQGPFSYRPLPLDPHHLIAVL